MRFPGHVLLSQSGTRTIWGAALGAAALLMAGGCGGGGGSVTVVPGPPATPTNVTAKADPANSRIRVNWNAATGATSYVIFRTPALAAAVRIQPRDTTTTGTPVPGTTFDDTTVQDGTTYSYQLQALNGSGGVSEKSAASAPVVYTAKPGVGIQFNSAAVVSVNLAVGAAATFTAAVTGLSPKTVTWSVQEGASGGTIDADGNYTAPANVGTYHVVAVSVADPAQQAVVTVVVGEATGTATVTVQ